MSRRVLITYNTWDEKSAALGVEICALLRQNGVEPFVYGDRADERLGADCTTLAEDCICMITVGGDGTILHWGKLAAQFRLPLLGVNTGRLGFMATLEPTEISRIPEIILGDFKVSRRMIMQVKLIREDGRTELKYALNDVVAERDRSSKLPEFHICCGDSEVSCLQADGVIFSTPTGSTAYALSAGGSIIAPDMECIECTPLCPHTLFSRPMIFSAEKEITLRCVSYQGSKVMISIDSERGISFGDGDTLRLSRGDISLSIIETGEGFFGAVRDKLMTPLK